MCVGAAPKHILCLSGGAAQKVLSGGPGTQLTGSTGPVTFGDQITPNCFVILF